MVESGLKWGKVAIFMFMGEYHNNIDEKGRITIPAKFRQPLGYEFIITRGLDNCLFVYGKEEWTNIINKYKSLPNTKDARKFMRVFLSGAIECTVDKQGRTNLSTPLIEYAKLNKECVIIGVSDHLEIWDNKTWQEFMADSSDISEIADSLFASNI